MVFFGRCAVGLAPGGMLVVKENNAVAGFVVDKDDSSVTRSDAYLKELFAKAGLAVARTADQKSFPKKLFQLRMYGLRPHI